MRGVSNPVQAQRIDPPAFEPAVAGPRYRLDHGTVGKLERLAGLRFAIGQLTDEDLDAWDPGRIYWELAQSVNASSGIEGEAVHADSLPLIFAAATARTSNSDSPALDARETAIRDIYDACVWALSRRSRDFVTADFVIELHRRMFAVTKSAIAGTLKTRAVVIRGAGYLVETAPADKTPELLERLCERTNRGLLDSEREGGRSALLTIGEFVCDFLAIHPFADGNGRIARALSTILLERTGYHFARFYPLDAIILETRSAYYDVLFRSQQRFYAADEDLTPWIAYYVDAVFNQARRAYAKVADAARRRD